MINFTLNLQAVSFTVVILAIVVIGGMYHILKDKND